MIDINDWLPVPNYEGLYEIRISTNEIRSLNFRQKKGNIHILKNCTHEGGYLFVGLWKDKKARIVYLHRISAEIAYGEKPKGIDTCHLDGNPQNNIPSNLYYGTRSQNIYDQVRHGTHYVYSRLVRGSAHFGAKPVLQYSLNNIFIRRWESVVEAAIALGIHRTNIASCARGSIGQAGGFIWQYVSGNQ